MWTEERCELLRKLWADGHSASQIAGRLGGITRNAVIGKVHRLGLAGRKAVSRMRARAGSTRHQPLTSTKPRGNVGRGRARAVTRPIQYELPFLLEMPVASAAAPAPIIEIPIPAPLRVQLLDLEEGMCRWPFGDPQSDEFHFCGRQKAEGSSYCEHHARIGTRKERGNDEAANDTLGRADRSLKGDC